MPVPDIRRPSGPGSGREGLGPSDEARRMEILRSYNILDTPPEQVFDRVAFMAAAYFKAPLASVSFIDEARQWFKAAYGLEIREVTRAQSFCQYTLERRQVTVFPDATADPLFQDNPLVHGPSNLRFYAGAPVLTHEGICLGTVAVLDHVARPTLTHDDEVFLQYLADMVVHELEIRLAASDVASEIERRQQSEQRLQMAVAHAPITLATVDTELRCTWVINPPPPLTEADVLGKTCEDIWPGESGETLLALKRQVLETGKGVRLDMAAPIGPSIRNFDMSLEPRWEAGRVVGLSFAAVDVTERKQAEQALAVAEARHRASLETAADGIIVADEKGVILAFSPAASRIFGYSEQEAIGRDLAILMPEPHRSAHCGYISRYLRTGEARVIGIGRELMACRKDGTTFPIDLQVREWWQNGYRMFTGTVRDITERREREQALKAAEDAQAKTLALLNTMIESIPDAIFCKNSDGRYIVANAATAKVLGVDTLIGRRDIDVLPAPLAARMRAMDAKVMANGLPAVSEDQVFDKERGQTRWFVTTKTPLRNQDEAIVGVVGLARDVTELRQIVEATRAARDNAEGANRAKSTFLAAASHDLRQPVQALALFTAALESMLAGHPAAGVVLRMRQSLEALQGLLEGLLDISRLDAGVVEVNRQRLPVRETVGHLVEEYRARANAKGLRFRALCSNQWVETDPKLIERVLRNLLENALKYTEQGGILLGCRPGGDWVRLQVIDTGIGIPSAQIEAVFQEFVQLDNPGRDRSRGLGLGLSIVRRLLLLMGHRMNVRSERGRGTSFTIELPRVAADQDSRPIPGAAPLVEPVGPKQVLVIEDEEMVRQGIQMLVGGWGGDVLAASDEEEAVAAATRQRMPDLIIADYRLQGGRLGTDAVKAVQRACGRAIPAMIVTGDTAPERIVEVKASGFAMAHKPVAPERLRLFIYEGR